MADGQLAAAAVETFGLGDPTEPPVLVARGAMGEVYRLTTDQGRFAVKRLFDWNPGDGAIAEARFTAVARHRGVVTPVELPCRNGELVAHTPAGRLRVFTWLDVAAAGTPPMPLDVLASFGRVLGILHAIAPASDAPVDEWYVRPPADDSWDELIAEATRAGSAWAPALAASRPSIAMAGEWARGVELGSARVCHRDLDPTNVLPLAGGGLAVLDWENLGPLPPDREVGVALFDWTTTDGDQNAQVRAIRDAYLRSGGTVDGLDPASFATLFATNLNHLQMQIQAIVAGATGSDLAYANAVIPRILPQPDDIARVHALAAAWNGAPR